MVIATTPQVVPWHSCTPPPGLPECHAGRNTDHYTTADLAKRAGVRKPGSRFQARQPFFPLHGERDEVELFFSLPHTIRTLSEAGLAHSFHRHRAELVLLSRCPGILVGRWFGGMASKLCRWELSWSCRVHMSNSTRKCNSTECPAPCHPPAPLQALMAIVAKLV